MGGEYRIEEARGQSAHAVRRFLTQRVGRGTPHRSTRMITINAHYDGKIISSNTPVLGARVVA